MPDTPSPSGADLARQALARARAAAKTSPPAKTRPAKRVRRHTGSGRDPQRLGGILDTLTVEEGWKDSLGGGNLLDRWNELCPTAYATTTRPTSFDPDSGTLTVSADSHTVAAHLRIMERQLIGYINGRLGKPLVRRVKVTVGTARPDEPAPHVGAPETAAPAASVKTRETASPGYRATLELALSHRPDKAPTDPLMAAAIRRQENALRANRQPEDQHREAYWAEADAAAGPQPGSMAASERAALARKRQEQAGRTQPRRAFDVA